MRATRIPERRLCGTSTPLTAPSADQWIDPRGTCMFAPANQAHLTLTLEGLEHDLKVLGFSGRQAISQPYRFDLEQVSAHPDLDLDTLLHQPGSLPPGH